MATAPPKTFLDYIKQGFYGSPLGASPEGMKGADLTQAEVDAVADFLVKNVVGITRITKTACAVFFGGNTNSPACAQYPN